MDFFLESQKRKEKVSDEGNCASGRYILGFVVLQELTNVRQQLQIIKQDIADCGEVPLLRCA